MNDRVRDKEFLTTSQVARLLSVSPDTVLKWVKAGKIKSKRTLGGHYRIPADRISFINGFANKKSDKNKKNHLAVPYQYCWEFLAAEGPIKSECRECITYQSRAMRCYQLKDMPGGLDHLNLTCDTDCHNCEYYKLVCGQAINVLVISESKKLIRDADMLDESEVMRLRFANSGYNAAVVIQEFRPDYIILDCSLGQKRAGIIGGNLFEDVRVPVTRIILSSRAKNIKDYCSRGVFGWITKPFTANQLTEYIHGVSQIEAEE